MASTIFISNHDADSGILLANPNAGGGIIGKRGSKITRGLRVVIFINGNYSASVFFFFKNVKIFHYTAFLF